MDNKGLKEMRKHYSMDCLNEADILSNPFTQFKKWLNEAVDSQIYEPNAMTIATATLDGKPSARVVLLKGITENGLIFYTNYYSQKGRELSMNPSISGVFLWGGLERQVRIEGCAEQLLFEESAEYFSTRPRESQISASVSPQSKKITSKEILELKRIEFIEKLQDKEVAMPENWGGYEIICTKFEFWQAAPGRFHDRICFEKKNDNWEISRLAP